MTDATPTPPPRRYPPDPRAGQLCTSCNKPKPKTAKSHCETEGKPSPACDWWTCTHCKAVNNAQGVNNRTNRDGTPRRRTGA